jgi:hypothetical protein
MAAAAPIVRWERMFLSSRKLRRLALDYNEPN